MVQSSTTSLSTEIISRPRPNEYVLVVDDDWMNREVMEAYLLTAGYEVKTANNGPKALAIAAEAPPSVVLLDINMPGMNGFEVCSRLKNTHATRFSPIIVISALDDDSDKLKAIEAGADDFLVKPFNSLIMLTRVKSLIRLYRLHHELEERNALLKQVLTRYVAEDLADIILSNPELHLKLGGSSRKVTIFFADIRGFTSFAEAHPAEQVVAILNEIFSTLTPLVFHHGGTFDKYMGDEIMGFFGAPISGDDDIFRAVKMALEMQQAFQRICARWSEPSIQRLGLGIGMHTGEAAIGNVGSEHVMSYTVIGDAVNIARRLQQNAPPGSILISKSTYHEVQQHVEAEMLSPMKVAGRTEPVLVYQLLKVKEG